MKKVIWIIIVILALLVGFIPITYLTSGVSKGYLELKSQEALRSTTWWFFLYMHIISGGIAILIGWLQFSSILLKNYSRLHRIIGKIYLTSALACSLSGFYIGFYATGGLIPAVGFITVSCIYFYTTLMGFLLIRKKQIIQHQNFMTYSYATCLSAVSLRLSVPFSYLFTDNYILSYSIIAWIAWIPNLLVAYWVNKNREEKIPIQSLVK